MPPVCDPSLPLDHLLPLRLLVVTLECLAPSEPRYFHQAALTAYLRFLLGDAPDYDTQIRIDAPESGRVLYRPGDCYRFSIICLAGGEPLLVRLIEGLRALPHSAEKTARPLPFRDNWRLRALHDAFTERGVDSVPELAGYDLDTLQREAALWADRTAFRWRWLSPARLLIAKERRSGRKGETRYCRNADDLPPRLLLSRLHDSTADLLRRRGSPDTPRGEPPQIAYRDAHLFWLDSEYAAADGEEQVMGGIAGRLEIMGTLTPAWWRLAILGQYLGMGQRTAFGFGRYQIGTPDGGVSYRRPLPAASLLTHADDPDNLARAWRHVFADSANLPGLDPEDEPAPDLDTGPDDGEDPDSQLPDAPLAALHADMNRLCSGTYAVPELRGHLIPKTDGGVRPLAVPPLRDRVLQRAVHQALSPAIEGLLAQGAHGFRPGRSRITASRAIQAAWRAGYRWVYESDVRDFFDSVNLDRLRDRLEALYDQDPLVDALIAWMRAPVRFQGELIERANGLPQGSPLSPLMANLMLDDFDSDMQAAGFHLIRFADDFIVLCKDPEEARRAGEAAAESLAEHGLALHPDKTRITAMDDGFRYLGYLFVNDLVVDVSGARAGLPDSDKIPPNSWLARLAERAPERMHKADTLEDIVARIAHNEPVPLGERDDEGALLCITGAPCLVATRDKHLHVLRDDQTVHHIPWSGLQAVILFGNHQITTPALHAALEQDIPIHLATGMGGYRGVLWSGEPGEQGHRLWLHQLGRLGDPETALAAAREVVGARLHHMKETLRLRERAWDAKVLDNAIRNINQPDNIDSLRGLEGSATADYYRCIAETLPEEMGFDGRNRRPPRDPFNVLLSLGFTLLYGYSDSILRSAGLLPWHGFYHQGRGRHAALASDLMEPFRHVVERAALTLVQRGEIGPANFSQSPAGACIIESAARRKYLALLIQRFETPVKAIGDETAEKLFTHLRRQALSLRTHIAEGTPFKAWRIR
jgi:group II intron reverse transcriptase/maturase/CRISPR-associated endonuclease Cas1